MGLYGSAPKPPDYGPIAEVNSKLGEEQMQIMREQVKWAHEQSTHMNETIDKVVAGALETDKQNRDFAKEQQDRYKKTYQPLEDQFAKEAKNYDTPARREEEAGRAISDVGQSFDADRKAAERRLQGFGIDPSMMRAGALDTTARLAEATAKAGAGTDARRRVEDVGRSLRADTINMGRGLPSQAAAAYATSLNAGNTAGSNAQGAVQVGSGALTAPAAWGQNAQGAYGNTINAMNSGYQNALSGYEANQQYGFGGQLMSLASAGLGAYASSFDEGGPIHPSMSPSRGAIPDDVPVRVSAGEHVIPEDVVRWKGQEFFEKLKTGARKAQAEAAGAIPDGAQPQQRAA